MKRDRTLGPTELPGRMPVVDTEFVSPGRGVCDLAPESVPNAGTRVATQAGTNAHPAGAASKPSRNDAGACHQVAWSNARLSAAVSAIRSGLGRMPSERPFGDEVGFFAALGSRRDMPAGTALVRRGAPMREVYLVERGAVAVLGDHRGRRPILAFALRREFCSAIPALLHQPAPWDAVAVTDAAVIAMPTEEFTGAVHERWVDRWTTRTLTWLAEVGARVADLDESDPSAELAGLLLRSRSEHSAALCLRTIADLLDLDDATVRAVIGRLEMLGAVRVSGRRISVVRPELLREAVAATPRW